MTCLFFTSSQPPSHFFQLVIFPLALIDISAQIILFIYAMTYQVILYGVYIGLFIVCTATGNYHKLEKPGDSPETKSDLRTMKKKQRLQRKLMRSKKSKRNTEAQNDSAYFTDID